MVLSGFLNIFGTNISKRMPRPVGSTRFQCPEFPLKDHVSGDRFQAAKCVAPVFSSTFFRAKIYIARETFGNEAARGTDFGRRNRPKVYDKNERCPGYEQSPK